MVADLATNVWPELLEHRLRRVVHHQQFPGAQRARHAAISAGEIGGRHSCGHGTAEDLTNGLRLESGLFANLFATEDKETGMSSFIKDGPGKARFAGR